MFLLVALALASLPGEVPPDASRFVLHGQVLDTTRAPLVDAHVAVRPEAGGPDRSATTDAQGRFELALDPGVYTVEVTVPGFLDASQRVSAGATGSESREFVLAVAPHRESVTVLAEPGYQIGAISSATRTLTRLRDVPQSVTVVTRELIKSQLM